MAITKHTILLLAGLLLCLSQPSVEAFSLSNSDYDHLVKPRCFNRSTTTGAELVLGQSVPIGLTIENVISMIERFERLNPSLKPDQVLTMLLKRFHYDGLKYNGNDNSQSNLEFKHSELTRAILTDSQTELPPFPENQFTEDEKCNLFFSISHVVNTTALKDEESKYVYWAMPQKTAKAPSRSMGNEVVLTTSKPSTPKAVQADFLEGVPTVPAKEKKLQKRETQTYVNNVRLTKRPREIGVASFLGSKTNPLSVNRVLLGTLVGFSNPSDKKISTILEKIRKEKGVDIEDKVVDTLLAVTLSDIYGIDTGDDINNQNIKVIFGGDGQWKSTVCHTQFVLNAVEGNWATLAEFRGGLDGYNIGHYLPTLLKEFPSITASQVLRFYYSRQGLSDLDGFCRRNKNFESIFEDLKLSEALSYLAMWNAMQYDNQYSNEKLNFYVNNIRKQFEDTLSKAAVRNDEENILCQGEFNNDIRSKPVESTVDAVFVLDITRKCTEDVECNQAAYVSSLAQKLKLGRGLGSASVLFNARGVDNPTIVDEDMKPVVTPLYSVLYNSTSNECPGCKSANYDGSSVEQISDRVEFLQLINTTLDNFEQSRSSELGVPGKALFWFDFGTVKPPPSDKIQAVKYEQVKRALLHLQRDWTWFGLGVNTTNLKDMVWEDGNLVSVDSNTAAIPNSVRLLSQKVSEVPSVLQYNDCKLRASMNVTYEGLITPGYKQYWAIYPDTFRSSSRIDLKFRADGGPFEVCHNRAPKPESKSESCKKAASTKEEVVFTVYSPCRNLLFEQCPPLYFTIAVDNSVAAHCTEPRCTNIGQVKWSLSHTGISCNRASAASISLIFIAFTIIASFAFNKRLSY